jgi:hypothetical protein
VVFIGSSSVSTSVMMSVSNGFGVGLLLLWLQLDGGLAARNEAWSRGAAPARSTAVWWALVVLGLRSGVLGSSMPMLTLTGSSSMMTPVMTPVTSVSNGFGVGLLSLPLQLVGGLVLAERVLGASLGPAGRVVGAGCGCRPVGDVTCAVQGPVRGGSVWSRVLA